MEGEACVSTKRKFYLAFDAAFFGAALLAEAFLAGAFFAGAFLVTPPLATLPGALAFLDAELLLVAVLARAALALVPGATFFFGGTSCLVLVEAFLAACFSASDLEISVNTTRGLIEFDILLLLLRCCFLGSGGLLLRGSLQIVSKRVAIESTEVFYFRFGWGLLLLV